MCGAPLAWSAVIRLRSGGLSASVRTAAALLLGAAHLPALSGCAARPAPCGGEKMFGGPEALAREQPSMPAEQIAARAMLFWTVAELTCHAERGDRYAAFSLGRLWEAAGTTIGRERAIHFYGVAAAPRPRQGPRQVYAPPVGDARFGTIISLPAGDKADAGLPEAAAALRRLTG